MLTRRILAVVSFLIILPAAAVSVRAQQPQIPTLQVCNQTALQGQAEVKLDKRADAVSSGKFAVRISLRCESNGTGYPTGTLEIRLSMSDSSAASPITATTFEQVTTTGKHTPTTYLNGRCRTGNIQGCRFWMMLSDNKSAGGGGTPDVIGFLVFDATGKRIAYGTGPVASGDIDIQSTPN